MDPRQMRAPHHAAGVRCFDFTPVLIVALASVVGARDLAPGQYGVGAKQEIPFGRPNHAQGAGLLDAAGKLGLSPRDVVARVEQALTSGRDTAPTFLDSNARNTE